MPSQVTNNNQSFFCWHFFFIFLIMSSDVTDICFLPLLQMFDDQDLGFFANFLGIFIFVLVIAYHFVMADPKYEGNWCHFCWAKGSYDPQIKIVRCMPVNDSNSAWLLL